jgi:hypothetical protein
LAIESSNDYSLLSLVLWLLTKIIAHLPPGSNAAAGLHHGCPFKNFDETQLRVTLQQLQVANSEIGEIVAKVKGQHYQIACGKYSTAASTLHCCPYPYPCPFSLPLPPAPAPAPAPAPTCPSLYPCPRPDTLTALTHLTSLPRYFEAKHKGSTLIETELGGISHPNQYFEQVPLRPCCVATPLPRHTSSPCHATAPYLATPLTSRLSSTRRKSSRSRRRWRPRVRPPRRRPPPSTRSWCRPDATRVGGLHGWLWVARSMAPHGAASRRPARAFTCCVC